MLKSVHLIYIKSPISILLNHSFSQEKYNGNKLYKEITRKREWLILGLRVILPLDSFPPPPPGCPLPIIEKKGKTNKTENGSILNYDYYILSKKL